METLGQSPTWIKDNKFLYNHFFVVFSFTDSTGLIVQEDSSIQKSFRFFVLPSLVLNLVSINHVNDVQLNEEKISKSHTRLLYQWR